MITAFLDRVNDALWRPPDRPRPRWRARTAQALRLGAVLWRDTARGQLTLRAMSLVYTSLLSLVPLLALSFSVLKAFGVPDQIEPFLEGLLAPLGEPGAQISRQIMAFIARLNVRVLGSMGLAVLAYTSVSLIQKIEESFNFIWHVARSRSFWDRFSRYLSLLLIGPILVFAALGLTASVMNAAAVRQILANESFGQLYFAISRVMPYLLVIAAFTFTYYFIPNTPVDPRAALIGGVVGGLAWQTAGRVFAEFVVASGRYQAIYSGFAILILFMTWLYLSWRILLLGASVAFYHQNPQYLVAPAGEPRLSNRMRERLALAVASRIAAHFRAGRGPLAGAELVHRLAVPDHAVQTVLDALQHHGLVAGTGGESAYLPNRPLEAIALADILAAVRSAGEEHYLGPADLPLAPRLERLLGEVDEAVRKTLAGVSLAAIGPSPAERPLAAGRGPARHRRRSPARPPAALAHPPRGPRRTGAGKAGR